jgi:hypothetical protein
MNIPVESDEPSDETLVEQPTEAGLEVTPPEPLPVEPDDDDAPDARPAEPEPAPAEVAQDAEPTGKGNKLSFFQLEEEEEEEQSPPRIPKKQQRQLNRQPRKNQPLLRSVTARFAACGRCSYFWAGYRVIFGMEELETAVANSKSGWLELIWNEQMPELLHKSFGSRFDISHLHYEGCCQECRRHFVYQTAEKEDEAAAFRIEISPRMAQ